MKEVFADAGYLIARLNPKDDKHESALRAARNLGAHKMVTTEMVLAEVFAYMSEAGAHARSKAVEMLEDLKNDPNAEIVPQTHKQFEAAANMYSERLDKGWSLTDCASFLLMKERGIAEALAHDHHFEQAEFIPLMRDA